MKTTILTIAKLSTLTGLSQAAQIALTNDLANTTDTLASQHTKAAGLSQLSTDGFAYNFATPTSALPADYGAATSFHGTDTENAVIAFTFTDGLFEGISIDLYGRGSNQDRDDNFTIQLYNGGALVETSAVQAIADNGNTGVTHHRVTLTAGTQADGIRIVDGLSNFFTLNEVVVNGTEVVPEPSSTALLGLGGLALILRRRK